MNEIEANHRENKLVLLFVLAFLAFLTLWIFLFAGEPDLQDAMIHYLMNPR